MHHGAVLETNIQDAVIDIRELKLLNVWGGDSGAAACRYVGGPLSAVTLREGGELGKRLLKVVICAPRLGKEGGNGRRHD